MKQVYNPVTNETLARVTLSSAQVLVSREDANGDLRHQLVDVHFASLHSDFKDPDDNVGVELIRATFLDKTVLPVDNEFINQFSMLRNVG